jgi:RNA polymerase sigma-70 factor, ECF subfamily
MTQDSKTREFVRLLTQHERRLYAYILALVPRWADADDILQETNLRLWDEFDKYVPGTDFMAWAGRVAFYQVLTFRKRHNRDRRLFSEQFVDAVAAAPTVVPEEADAQHLALADCMEKLSESNRELLRACYSADTNIKEAAARLGRSLPTVYRALSRVRISLHECVETSMQQKRETPE